MKEEVQVQYACSRYGALSLTASIFFENMLASYMQDENGRYNESYAFYMLFRVKPAFLYFPCGTAPRGFYITAYPVLGYDRITQDRLHESFFTIGAGAAAGWQFVMRSGFTVNVSVGAERMRHIAFPGNRTEAHSATDFHLFGLPVDVFASVGIGWTF